MGDEALILQDGELRLRTATLPSDFPLAEAWYQDPEVMRFSEGDEQAKHDLAMIEKMYRYLADRGELYIIEVLGGGRWLPIGDAALAADTIPITIGVGEYRSRGYGKRVLKLLVDRAAALGWGRLKVKGVYTYNLRAKKLYESAGFMQDGEVYLDGEFPSWKFVKEL